MSKSASEVAGKYSRRGSDASQDYTDGVANTSKDQSGRAIAAKKIYEDALREAFARDAYAKGLQKVGTAGWKAGVAKTGAGRYAEGVGGAAEAYAAGSAPYDAARKAADNLPRGTKGSQANFDRQKAVALAQRAVKVGSAK